MKNKSLILFAILFILASCVQNPAKIVNNRSQSQATKFNRTNPYKILISPGDNIYNLAKKYNIDARAIIEYNNLRPPYILTPGTKLRLPVANHHNIVADDSLYAIAKSYNVSIASLRQVNNLSADKLTPGEQLIIPYSIYSDNKQKEDIQTVNNTDSSPSPLLRSNSSEPKIAFKPSNKSPSTSSGNIKFTKPLEGKIISNFGPKKGGLYNDGINLAAKAGSPVKAAESGIIAYNGSELKGYGNLILIKHNNDYLTAYAHLQSSSVKKGDAVKKGQVIAFVGQTGHVHTPQLHFSIRKGRTSINPDGAVY